MGFDVQRFVDPNIDEEFICNICQDVLEDPLMIIECQHLFCSKCIRDCIRAKGICPQDRSSVGISQLVEPVRIVKNLLNKLKIKCQFSCDGCEQVLTLGQMQSHYYKCERNPQNQRINCFCKHEFAINEFTQHRDHCLNYMKNELNVVQTQMSTYSSIFYGFDENLSAKLTTDSEIKFLYKRFKQSLPKDSIEYKSIQKSLLFMVWKLLNNEINPQKNFSTTIRYIKYGLEDLTIALDSNYDNCYDFIALKAFEFIYLCESVFKNKQINRYIAQMVKHFIHFDHLFIKLINKKFIKTLIGLMNANKNDIKTCIDCATVLSTVTLLGAQKWTQLIPEKDMKREDMLNEFYLNVRKWKLNQNSDISFESFTEIFAKLKSNETTVEINVFHVWLLALMTKSDAKKYVPMIDTENGLQFLVNLKNNTKRSGTSYDFLTRLLDLVIDKCNDWQKSANN